MPESVGFDAAFRRACELAEQFLSNSEYFCKLEYSEAEVRLDFIDPLVAALGWDVYQRGSKNPYKREVRVEKALSDGTRKRRADYAFFPPPDFRDAAFYIEAKRPSLDIRNESSYFQAVRYAWSSGNPIVVLTNFRQLHILDSRARPEPDGILDRLIKSFDVEDLRSENKFAEIYYLFSREAVLEGGINDFAQGLKKLKGKSVQFGLFQGGHEPIDKAFLSELDDYRVTLARGLKGALPTVTPAQLTEMTQRTIDRLVLMRFLEDKHIEPEPLVDSFIRAQSAWAAFRAACRRLDRIYNGIIFRPHAILDSPSLDLSDSFLSVCERLSHTASPYNFDSIPVHVLGSIYERFLGKSITTATTGVILEDRPEIRKSGGVYYTPEHVVRYIVQRTLGQFIDGKNPAQIRKIAVADLACGSGSFLIEVADSLFRHYTSWYAEHPEDAAAHDLVEVEGELHLSLRKKREILLSNVFGIDIDPQAVEVAQLSLCLKLLEEESAVSAYQYQAEVHGTLLPSLDRNLVCGNALLEPPDTRGFQLTQEQEREINALDLKSRFRAVFKRGGFDVIVGNPPYFSIDATWGAGDARAAALKYKFPNVHTDKTDILFYFLARATALSKGFVSMIISRAFLEAHKAAKLRSLLSSKTHVAEIIDFQNEYVFEGVGITTCIVTFSPGSRSTRRLKFYRYIGSRLGSRDLTEAISDATEFEKIEVQQGRVSETPWNFGSTGVEEINDKLDARGELLGHILSIGQGMQTGANTVFHLTPELIREFSIPDDFVLRRARNSDIKRYEIANSGPLLLYVYGAESFRDLPDGVQKLLLRHKKRLTSRAAYKRGDCEWWQYTWPLHKDLYEQDKIFSPYLSTLNRFAIDDAQQFVGLTDTTVIFDGQQSESMPYLVALLNSRALTFRFRTIAKLKSGGIYEYFANSISRLPIRRIDFENELDVRAHSDISELAGLAADATRRQAAAGTERDRAYFSGKLQGLLREIDELVGVLYDLSDKDIAAIDASLKRASE